MRPGFCVYIIVAVFFFSACSHFPGKTPAIPTDSDTQALLDALSNKNNDLRTFKGVGKITLWNKGKIHLSERVAWVGSTPLSFRVEVLFSGRPLIKIASDGEWLYFHNAQSAQHPYGRISLSRDNMERILQIPIKPAEFMALLTGRVPLVEHDFASLEKHTGGEGYVLELKKKWQGVVERIYLDRSKATVRMVELFDDSGFLIYRATFDGFKRYNGSEIPSRMVVSTESRRRFRLDISRYQTDIAVNEALFVLTPP